MGRESAALGREVHLKGWHFSIADTNVVAWVTAPEVPGRVLPPIHPLQAHRLMRDMGTPAGQNDMGLISTDVSWLKDIFRDCQEYLGETSWEKNALKPWLR